MEVRERAQSIQTRIEESCQKSGRSKDDVHLIAVTKYVSAATAQEALESGIQHIGENRLEGLIEKQARIGRNGAVWHFIGSLQSRKVKDVLPNIDYLHSLDRLSLAKEIEKRAELQIACFVQVNVSGEDSKHGLPLDKVESFIQDLSPFSKIKVVGLMTMAPLTEDQTLIRPLFRRLKELQEKIAAKGYAHAPCNQLSMGMSNDFEVAIEEGATFIRIGTALVGKEW